MEVLEAPASESENDKQVLKQANKRTNTPKIPSMFVIPAPEADYQRHEQKCPLNKLHPFLPGQGDHALFTPPSSTSGTDSSIRVRNRSRCTERRWFVSVSLAMVITLVIASAGIYFGYQFLKANLPFDENVFKGEFVVTRGDFIPVASDSSGLNFVQSEKSRFYQLKLDQIFSASHLAKSYLFNEVLFLEGLGPKGVKVHFNVHMNPQDENITSSDVHRILEQEIRAKNPKESFLAEIEIDSASLHVEERAQNLLPPDLRESSSTINFGENTSENPRRRSFSPNSFSITGKCVPFTVDFCKDLPYNYTIFPNGLEHTSLIEADAVVETFKDIISSKCHTLGYEFLCQILQPVCYLDKLVLPCKDFCLEFMDSCDEAIPDDLKAKIDCDQFATEADGPGACISKPGCVAELRNAGKADLICDGVVDCPDFSDELYCPYCPEHHFHCGVTKTCISKEKMCDGNIDCDNGADERGCLSLAPNAQFVSYVHQYFKSGYLVYQDSGEVGKVCADNMNTSIASHKMEYVLQNLGESMCSMLEYESMVDIKIVRDTIDLGAANSKYVDMVGPMTGDKNFINAPCTNRNVVNITCDHLACGRRPAHVTSEARTRLDTRRDVALHGDWPWLVALYKNNQHVCDGTLVNDQWIMTTASCFQGQGKAKWIARFASVRLQSRAPWEQKRTIVGMVKSPVEGNSVVMLKMNEPILFSDFARPICLPIEDSFVNKTSTCVTLGWTLESEEMAKVYVTPTAKGVCEEISEVPPHTICTEEHTAPGIPCSGEEFAGAPLLCQYQDSWHLIGILAWRKGCSTVGQRPRLYDRVAVNSDWAEKVMLKLNDDTQQRVPRRS